MTGTRRRRLGLAVIPLVAVLGLVFAGTFEVRDADRENPAGSLEHAPAGPS